MRFLRFGVCVTVLFLFAALLFSCSNSSKNPADSGQNGSGEWKTGQAAVYTVSGSSAVSVQDTVSGATFTVTPGSNATLTVAPVTSGPAVPLAGIRFHVDYTGSGPVTVKIPANPDAEEVALFSYGALEGAAIDDRTGNIGWWGVQPSKEENGYREYTLDLAAPGAGKAAAGGAEANNFAISRVSAGTGDFNHLRTIYQTVNQVIETWITNLPADMQESAREKVKDLPWTVMWSSSGNSYKHITNAIFSPKVILYFTPEAQLVSIAHETGHYMCHALLGDAKYNELYDRFPSEFWGGAVAHDFGSYREGRKEILEDYPYISIFLTTGDLDKYDLTSVAKVNNVRDMTNSADPAAVDYPSHEAFGAAMLASLRRTSDTIYTFSEVKSWEKAKVPVIGAPWSDVLGILARGPRDPNELRAYIQDYLDSRGNEYRFKFPAMMEPLGWSYNGTGTVVDEKGAPVSGVNIQPVSQDGDEEYRLFMSTATGADGKFWLPRVFPGNNLLRLFYNSGKDSMDFPVAVDWEKPTNVALNLGKFTLGESPGTRRLSLSATQEIKLVDDTIIAKVKTDIIADVTGYGLQPNSIQTTAGLDMAAGKPVSVKISAVCTVEVVNSTLGTPDYYTVYSFGQPRFNFSPVKYGTFTVTETRNGGNYTGEFTFPNGGDMLHLNVRVVLPSKRETYEKGELTYTSDSDRSITGPSCYLYAK